MRRKRKSFWIHASTLFWPINIPASFVVKISSYSSRIFSSRSFSKRSQIIPTCLRVNRGCSFFNGDDAADEVPKTKILKHNPSPACKELRASTITCFPHAFYAKGILQIIWRRVSVFLSRVSRATWKLQIKENLSCKRRTSLSKTRSITQCSTNDSCHLQTQASILY